MPNTFFQFKQFTVHQEKAALKVSTDSCLFGAWVAHEVRSKLAQHSLGEVEKYEVRRVLDIGAGTGLLMLMLAQKCEAKIDGIEMDDPSYLQAKENMDASPWKERLQLFQGNVKQYQFQQQYNFIISNPPFYEGDLKSDSLNRNIAMHDEGLKLEELLQIVDAKLTDDGGFAVLLPYHRADQFIADAIKQHLHLSVRLNVKQSVKHTFFRSILLFSRKKTEEVIDELSIKDASNQYTINFIELLKDYYLYL